jgi:hypothetical protein
MVGALALPPPDRMGLKAVLFASTTAFVVIARPALAQRRAPDAGMAAVGGSVGADLGGGIEYFFTRDATITGELLYHKVGGFASPVTTFNDGSFLAFAIGAKKYF